MHLPDVNVVLCSQDMFRLIAIMLGCLRMTVDEALEAYKTLSPEIFKKKWWTQSQAGKYTGAELRRYWFEGKNLENAVQKLLRDRRLDPDLKLLELEASDCRVLATRSRLNRIKLKTYI